MGMGGDVIEAQEEREEKPTEKREKHMALLYYINKIELD